MGRCNRREALIDWDGCTFGDGTGAIVAEAPLHKDERIDARIA